MRRFFVEPENITGPKAVLTGTEARHIHSVLRLSTDTAITLFDGSGTYYEARLTRVSSKKVEARIVTITPYIEASEDFRPALHLGFGLLKGKKMDFIIQKTTELGIDSLRPFRSQYCAANGPTAGRLRRWQKITLESCKQCNRPKPPVMHEVIDLEALLNFACKDTFDLKLMFWEEPGQQSLPETFGDLSGLKSVLLLIGPEGGFNPEEVAAAKAAGFQPVTLGSRVLRAETAAIAAVSILQHELGNLE